MNSASASPSDAGMSWVLETERGARALLRGNPVMAAGYWALAREIAEQFAEVDPRRACSLNNLALIDQLDGELQGARQTYELARRQWQDAHAWVEGMQLQRRSRSSLHHLRLESRHREAYDRPYREGYLHVLETGEAVTLVNLAQCLELKQLVDEARSLRVQAEGFLDSLKQLSLPMTHPQTERLRAALDHRDLPGPGSGLGAAAPAHFGMFSELATEKRWVIDEPAELTDEGSLMAAVQLAGVVGVGQRSDERGACGE